MEPIAVLRSVEGLVFEVAMWPRAMISLMWKALLRPWWVRRYVAEEWEKPETERFAEYMSPILFWLLAVVVPYFLLIDHALAAAAQRFAWLTPFASQAWPLRFFVAAFFLAGGPLSTARRLRKAGGDCQTRDKLKRLFSIQCVCLAPAYVLFLLALLAGILAPRMHQWLPGVFLWGSFVSALYVETAVIWTELRTRWHHKVDAIIPCVICWFRCVILVGLVQAMLLALGTSGVVRVEPAPALPATLP